MYNTLLLTLQRADTRKSAGTAAGRVLTPLSLSLPRSLPAQLSTPIASLARTAPCRPARAAERGARDGWQSSSFRPPRCLLTSSVQLPWGKHVGCCGDGGTRPRSPATPAPIRREWAGAGTPAAHRCLPPWPAADGAAVMVSPPSKQTLCAAPAPSARS